MTDLWGLPVTTVNTLLASFIALIGIALNLAYDRKKRKDDREASLRQDVLLQAVEGASAYANHIAEMINKVGLQGSGG